jgi:dCTP deaminase
MILTDGEIKELIRLGKIVVEPHDDKQVIAGKLRLHLGQYVLIPQANSLVLDPTDPNSQPQYKQFDLVKEPYILKPKEFVLGQTLETIRLSANVGMLLDGATTLARLGLTVHQSSMYIPPGQDAHIITLEIYNVGPWEIKLSYGLRIGKLIAFKFSKDNLIETKEYNPYNGQQVATGAIFEKERSCFKQDRKTLRIKS